MDNPAQAANGKARMYTPGMPQDEIVALIRRVLMSEAEKPLDAKTISDRTDIPKGLIDKGRSLSAAPDIKRHPASKNIGIRWAFRDLSAKGKLEVPNVQFTVWEPWNQKTKLRTTLPYGGVYLLGHFKPAPKQKPRVAPALPKNVVYVGETHDLNVRPLATHNRTRRYIQIFGDADYECLYVSVFRIFRREETNRHLLRRYSDGTSKAS